MTIEWWYWAVGGLLLIMLELVIPSFFVLWFGLGALLVGVVLLVADLSLPLQLGLWALASLAMVALWFKVFKPNRHKTLIGTAAGEVIGEVGLLVGPVEPFQRGRVRFQRPILGAEEWPCTSEQHINAGERVRLVSVEGSYLKVAKA